MDKSSPWYIKEVLHYVGRKKYRGKPTKKYLQYIRDNYDKLEYVPLLSKEIWEYAFPDRPYPVISFDRRSIPTWSVDYENEQ